MKRPLAILCALLLAASCSSPGKTIHGALDSARVFPDGTYQHKVRLHIPLKDDAKDFEFQGVAKLSPEWVRIAILSAFGTTAFKITEDRKSGDVKTEIFVDALKPQESRLKSYYSTLRLLLLARQDAKNADDSDLVIRKRDEKGRVLEAAATDARQPAVIHFEQYDAHGIPGQMSIAHPLYQVEIQVVGYEL